MSVITYPDGSQLTSTALTDAQIQTIFQVITAQMLGLLTVPWSFSVTLVSGQPVLSVNSTLNLYAGLIVTATGIPAGTVINGVNTVNSTISLNAAATASGVQSATAMDPDVYYAVRIGWQIEGQPGPPIDVDTVTVRCTPIDTEYSRMRDVVGSASGTNTYTYTDIYTRAWKVFWTFYGPDGLDKARAVVAGLVTVPFVEASLAGNNLYVNPSIKQPQRVPDNFQARWWERNDLEVEFNEQVNRNLHSRYGRQR